MATKGYKKAIKIMTYRENSNAADTENPVGKDASGGAYKAYTVSSDGKRGGGCGTSLNGMFRGDCDRCDHLDCAQCNWQEQK